PSKEWHYLHLYDPQITSPGSNMAPFPFLFEEHLSQPRPTKAGVPSFKLPNRELWIVPKREARELVAYLLSLQQLHQLEQVR
ncbi:MAG: cytochrome-c oxidase, partial [Deltaproteobacteria bacterium]|nr:cytochrome-c oxidase [Deltaproteobacteria bacterium]